MNSESVLDKFKELKPGNPDLVKHVPAILQSQKPMTHTDHHERSRVLLRKVSKVSILYLQH